MILFGLSPFKQELLRHLESPDHKESLLYANELTVAGDPLITSGQEAVARKNKA